MPGAQQQLDDVGECPCDRCKFRERCGPERLACQAFSMFLHGESEARWRNAPRAPSRAVFQATELRDMAQRGERATKEKGRPDKNASVSRLSHLGIDAKESERFQQIAAVTTTPSGRV
jgi:hypothetical protein